MRTASASLSSTMSTRTRFMPQFWMRPNLCLSAGRNRYCKACPTFGLGRGAQCRRTHQTMLRRIERQLGVGFHPKFVQQASAIRGHRLGRKSELAADRGDRPPGREEAQNLELAVGELLVGSWWWS